MVALKDPFVEAFGEQRTLTRDLFFSGHTATLLVVALSAPTPWMRRAAFVATALVAAGVLVQHAHYTVDVVAAPFFAYAAWRAATAMVGASDGRGAARGEESERVAGVGAE
jgi:membrane-associated phospholipid phosphatase